MKTSLIPSLIRGLSLASIAFLASSTCGAAESLSVLLQKAIYAEETEGNLESAIKIYEQIAAEMAANRPLAAQAQYRLAVCYQKQGRKEQAVMLLNDVLKAFPQEEGLGQKIRQTLAELGVPAVPAVVTKKLPRLVAEWVSAISPDGRYIGFMPNQSHEIFVYEGATGKTWKIAECASDERVQAGKYLPVQDGRFSNDGRLMAYTRNYRNKEKDVEGWVANVDGSGARKFFEVDRSAGSFWTFGWTADAAEVLAFLWEPARPAYQTLVGINVQTGQRREIRRISSTNTGSYELSWNARYLAFRRGENRRRIVVLDLSTGVEEVVIERDAVGVFGWAPDDRSLLISSDRPTGASEIWSVAIKDGKPNGPLEFLVKLPEIAVAQPKELCWLGNSRDGGVYYTIGDENESYPYVMERLLARLPALLGAKPKSNQTELFLDEITGENGLLVDRKLGLSAKLPEGWAILNAGRTFNGAMNGITLTPGIPESIARLNYHAPVPADFISDPDGSWMAAVGPKPNAPDEIDPWLRKWATVLAEHRKNDPKSYANYHVRDSGLKMRTIGGRPAVYWEADFQRNGQPWIEHQVFIYADPLSAGLWVQSAAKPFESVKASFEHLLETVRLP